MQHLNSSSPGIDLLIFESKHLLATRFRLEVGTIGSTFGSTEDDDDDDDGIWDDDRRLQEIHV